MPLSWAEFLNTTPWKKKKNWTSVSWKCLHVKRCHVKNEKTSPRLSANPLSDKVFVSRTDKELLQLNKTNNPTEKMGKDEYNI